MSMEGRRLKSSALVVGLTVSALTIVAWTQSWFDVVLVADEPGASRLTVGGDVAAGGLAALGLAGLALVGALSIAGPVIRAVLGVLEMLLGATVALSATLALAAPVVAASPSITESTGVSGRRSIDGLVASVSPTGWPVVAVVLGVATAGVGVWILATGRRWPGASRRYRAVAVDAGGDVPGGDVPEA
ncbi:MAG: hypothetical protein RI885_2777, partial [Actinomycetota bacterium]